MKAIQVYEFGPPEVMKLEEIESLEPSPDQILVEIKAVGVNPVDTYIRSGSYGSRKFPFTPGLDAAGIVTQVGGEAGAFSSGQRVYICGSVTGTYAQSVLCKTSQVHLLPDSVSFEQGAAMGIPYGTAYRGLFQRAGARQGETVLIHGASGGVGIAAVQLAKAAGLKVIATAGSKAGQQLLKEQGAELILDHNDPSHLEQTLEFTDGEGVDVLLEMLANVNLGNDLPLMARHGRVVIIGSRGPVQIDPRDAMKKEIAILGTMSTLAAPEEKAAVYSAIGEGLASGALVPVVAQSMPLSEAAAAHHEIMEKSHLGKIVLIP